MRQRVKELQSADGPVVVVGEPGVGKRGVAAALHHGRSDASGPLVELVCEDEPFEDGSNRLPSVVLEPEPWRKASGGCLILVRADRVPRNAWRQIIERASDRTWDVRLIATWQEAGRAVDDLPSGLRPLRLAPLRERIEDLPLLVARWSTGRRRGMWTAACLEAMATYAWPDNLRELYGEVRRIVAVHPPDRAVDVDDLAPRIRATASGGELDLSSLDGLELADARLRFESWFVQQALKATDGNQTRAAERLGLSRAGLFRKLRRLHAADEDIG
jgi:DNA-binding NtrC family response regulator